MFTGIITGLGRIVSVQSLGSSSHHGKRLTIETPSDYLNDVGLGDSIAINGACMTAVDVNAARNQFAIDISAEKKGTAISAMLALEVDNDELVKRLLLRGKESGRPDDQNEEIIRNRVNEYNVKTLPLKKPK